MAVNMETVGVIDIGSNSIKLLVASKAEDGKLVPILQTTDETRIGDGISKDDPRLLEESMEAACHSVKRLKADAETSGAGAIAVVATSAVRDAGNSAMFADRLRKATGLKVRILTGSEEAELIGLGIRCDPDLGSLHDFYVFDLGGGSLEAIKFRNGNIEQAVSLPLGCVRLTERFIPDPEVPFSTGDRVRIVAYAREVIEPSLFTFDLPAGAEVVVTGGTAAVACLIRETRDRTPPDAPLTLEDLEHQLTVLGALRLSERREFPGLPPKRADIFPTALATLLAVLRLGNLGHCRQSFYNLRYGMAMRLLAVE